MIVLLCACDGPKKQQVFEHLGTTENHCEGGGIATNDDVGVTAEVDLLSAPASKTKVVNEKSTSVLGHTDYQQLDPTERLTELCRQPLWAKVQVKEPDWLTNVIGWVPVKVLRPIQHDKSGARVFTQADFVWDSDTSPYKTQLVAAVNKIVR